MTLWDPEDRKLPLPSKAFYQCNQDSPHTGILPLLHRGAKASGGFPDLKGAPSALPSASNTTQLLVLQELP